MRNTDRSIDAGAIRETLALGLDVWGTCPLGGAALDLLVGELERHAGLLLLAAEDLAPRLRDPLRTTADHVVARARGTLLTEVPERLGDQPFYVDDLAVVVRALLALHEAAVLEPA